MSAIISKRGVIRPAAQHALSIFAAGLWGWWDASQQTGYADGGAVTTITDFSGNARTITKQGGTVTFETNEQNGKPTFRFRSGGWAMSSVIALVDPITVFAVMKTPTVAVAGNETAIDGTSGNEMRMFTSSATDFTTYSGAFLVGTGAFTTAMALYEARFNGASSYLKIARAEIVAGNAGAAAPNGVTLGAFGGLDTAHADMDLCELAIVNGSLPSAGQIAAFEAAMLAKWGV